MSQTLDDDKPQTAWAIFLFDTYSDEHLFHSAHWSKARAREMIFPDWKKRKLRPKIVKISFTIVNPLLKEKHI